MSGKAAAGAGNIRKKTVMKNGKEYTYWEGRVTTGFNPGTGKQIQQSFSGKSQKEVLEKLQAAAVDINNDAYIPPSRITVAQWLNIWLSDYCKDIKYNTLRHYRAQCKTHIIPALGAIPLCKLTTPQLQRFFNSLETPPDGSPGLSPKSIKNMHGILSKALNVAVEIAYLKTNPATRCKLTKVAKKEIKPLTDEQIQALMNELDDEEYAAVFKLYLFTGLRECEALGLTWDCIDFNKGVLNISKQLQKRTAKEGGYTFAPLKNNKTRKLTVAPFVLELLKTVRVEQMKARLVAGQLWQGFQTTQEQKTALVFTTALGTPINPKVIYLHYKKLATRINAPNSCVHDLRHTYAVLALQNGDDVKTVQENLGHATASFTLDVYGHVSERMKTDSADRMQRYINSLF